MMNEMSAYHDKMVASECLLYYSSTPPAGRNRLLEGGSDGDQPPVSGPARGRPVGQSRGRGETLF